MKVFVWQRYQIFFLFLFSFPFFYRSNIASVRQCDGDMESLLPEPSLIVWLIYRLVDTFIPSLCCSSHAILNVCTKPYRRRWEEGWLLDTIVYPRIPTADRQTDASLNSSAFLSTSMFQAPRIFNWRESTLPTRQWRAYEQFKRAKLYTYKGTHTRRHTDTRTHIQSNSITYDIQCNRHSPI